MPWLQIILDTDAQSVERISDSLTELGAVAVTLLDAENQPLYEPPLNTTPLWKQTRVIGLFENDTDSHQLQKQLQARIVPLPRCQIQILKDQEWTRVWMADFHPLQFGKRVWICPSWQRPPDPQAINIMLDPGLAFGTGTHPTTALCLEWLDQQNDLSDQTLIDYGCGSGILAITALKLGAAHVWAVDNDPQALLATLDNAKKNHVETAISPVLPEQLPHHVKADAILANILATPLIKLAPTLTAHLNTKAPLVLSGLLKEQVDDVIAAYTPYATIVDRVEQDNWIRLVVQGGNRLPLQTRR
ncbi:MAG TPA: 50S ribosomal protein L11 methyltransferase [Gammaproteobacteria bacterium]|nr:50S ribosomal protein L11 methyltransferase [Gammaproteobacteria bacterium]